jgi:hypothetical protein
VTRQVFVSYSLPDHECAVELVSRVEADGIACWMAPRDISPSADWAEEIIDAISAARVMVLVFSSSSNTSPQVRREVERAVHKQVSILPFRIEDTLPSKSLEYFLSTQHWLDAYPPPREQHYARLSAHLRAMISSSGAPVLHEPGAAPPNRAEGPFAFDVAHLHQLETELAQHVGPVARLLVRRAASDAPTPHALIARLATELESDTDRRQFVANCHALMQCN